MKRYTAKEIAEYLMSEESFDWEYDEAYYYLYYTIGKLGGNVAHNDFWTKVRARYIEDFYNECLEKAKKEYYGEDFEEGAVEIGEDDDRTINEKALDLLQGPGGMWDKESLDNPGFMEVAQEMADELNAYLEEQEQAESQPSLWDQLIEEAARELAEERRKNDGKGNA